MWKAQGGGASITKYMKIKNLDWRGGQAIAERNAVKISLIYPH